MIELIHVLTALWVVRIIQVELKFKRIRKDLLQACGIRSEPGPEGLRTRGRALEGLASPSWPSGPGPGPKKLIFIMRIQNLVPELYFLISKTRHVTSLQKEMFF